jgi:hypothetical protein
MHCKASYRYAYLSLLTTYVATETLSAKTMCSTNDIPHLTASLRVLTWGGGNAKPGAAPSQTNPCGYAACTVPHPPDSPSHRNNKQRILDPSRPALITSIRNIWRLWAYINLAGISGNTTKKCIHELYNYIYWEATV